jgi:hypothetical protein
MNWATSDPGAMGEPVAYESAGFVAGQAADVLIVESLQRAEERNAEILAEIVDDGTHGGAIAQWAENDQGVYRLTELALKDEETPQGDVGRFDQRGVAAGLPGLPTEHSSTGLVDLDWRRLGDRFSIFSGALTKLTLKCMAVGVSVLILALLTGLYRQGITAVPGQSRSAPVAGSTGFWSSHNAAEHGSDTPRSTSKQAQGEKGRALEAKTTMVQGPRAAGEQLTDGATVVIVQPRDDLRQICLRNFGRYDLRLVNKIIALNPELTDPDHINVGQRILLPGPRAFETAASATSAAAKR